VTTKNRTPVRLRVLLTGDTNQAEFRHPIRLMTEQTDLRILSDIDEATALLSEASPPDLVVVAQARPGQYQETQIDRIRQAAPLTAIIALLGTWCEGEVRTGFRPADSHRTDTRPTDPPWPGVPRIYWHQWPARWAGELERIAANQCPAWGLPLTSTAEELEERHAVVSQPDHHQGLIAIRARHAVTYHSIADACRLAGYATVWLRKGYDVQPHGMTAVLWDDVCCDEAAAAEMAQLVQAIAPVPVIALLHPPRIDDYEQAHAAGVAGIVSKPFQLDELFWQLDQAVAARFDPSSKKQVAA